MGGTPGRPRPPRPNRHMPCASRRHPRPSGRLTTENFRGLAPNDHPLGHQPLHRNSHRPRLRRNSGTTSGASGCSAACPAAAWASLSNPPAKQEALDSNPRDHDSAPSGSWRTPSPSPWIPSFTTLQSTHMGPLVRSIMETKPSYLPPTTTSLSQTRCGLLPRNSHRQPALNSINSPGPAGQNPYFLLLSSPSSTPSFLADRRGRETATARFPATARRTRLRSGPSTNKSAATCATAASDWPKTAFPPTTLYQGRLPCRHHGLHQHQARPIRAVALGEQALANGEVAVVITLAAGAGSRWTQGAGVCKALHPFARPRRSAIAPSSRPTSASPASAASRPATTIPACLHDLLPDPRTDDVEFLDTVEDYSLPRTRCTCPPAGPWACA